MTVHEGGHIRMVEAVLFAAEEPLDAISIAERLPQDVEVEAVLEAVRAKYEQAGFHLVKIDKKYAFRSAPDLSHVLQKHVVQQRRLSRRRSKRWRLSPITNRLHVPRLKIFAVSRFPRARWMCCWKASGCVCAVVVAFRVGRSPMAPAKCFLTISGWKA